MKLKPSSTYEVGRVSDQDWRQCADVNGDGQMSANDTDLIPQRVAGLVKKFMVERTWSEGGKIILKFLSYFQGTLN